MKLSNVAALYGMRLRARLGQELLALIGIAVGVSLLFAALVANTSLTGSFERAHPGSRRRRPLPARVARRAASTSDKLQAVRQLPGVAGAAAILEVRAELRGATWTPIRAADRRHARASPSSADRSRAGSPTSWLANVRALALPTPLVRSLGLTLGQSVALNVSGGNVAARLGAKLHGVGHRQS